MGLKESIGIYFPLKLSSFLCPNLTCNFSVNSEQNSQIDYQVNQLDSRGLARAYTGSLSEGAQTQEVQKGAQKLSVFFISKGKCCFLSHQFQINPKKSVPLIYKGYITFSRRLMNKSQILDIIQISVMEKYQKLFSNN